MVHLLGAPFRIPVRKDGDGAAPAGGPTQTDVHVDAILSPLKPKKRRRKYRAPFFKGEGEGHDFRGNQYTGGIAGPGGDDPAASSSASAPDDDKDKRDARPIASELGETRPAPMVSTPPAPLRWTAFKDVKVGDVLANGQKVTDIAVGSVAGFLYSGPNDDAKRYDLDDLVQIRATPSTSSTSSTSSNAEAPAVDLSEITSRVTQSVHEVGGTRWNGEKVGIPEDQYGNSADAAIATKIDINARLIDRLSRELATDKEFGDWATRYAAKVGSTVPDSMRGRATWDGIVGAGHINEHKYNLATQKWGDDVIAWVKTEHVDAALVPGDEPPLFDLARGVAELQAHKDAFFNAWTDEAGKTQYTPRSNAFALLSARTSPVVANAVAKLGQVPDDVTDDGQRRIDRQFSGMKIALGVPAPPPAPVKSNFYEPAAALPTDGRVIAIAAKVRSTIDTWAGSSGDTTIESIALQRAVADHFAMSDADEAPLKRFADKKPITSPDDIDSLQTEYWLESGSKDSGSKDVSIADLKVGDMIFDGETVTKIDPHLDSKPQGFYVVSTVERNGRKHEGAYTFWNTQTVTVDTRTDEQRAQGPTNTAWKIAGRMVDDQRPFYAHFVQAVYDNTQADLKKAGATELLVYRGMHVNEDAITPAIRPPIKSYERYGDGTTVVTYDPSDAERSITQQPLSSWSSDETIAKNFSSSGSGRSLTLAAVVPAARVWGLASGTGVGCLDEREVVVLGGPGTARVTWDQYGWTSDHVTNADAAKLDLSHAVDTTPKPGDPDPVADWLAAHPDPEPVKKADTGGDSIAVDAELVNADWIKYRTRDVSSDGSRITPVVQHARDARDHTVKFVKVGEAAGHAFRGNQYITGQSGGDGATSDEGGTLAPTTSPPSSAADGGEPHSASSHGGADVVPITATDTQGRGRSVSLEEFHALAGEGQAQLADMAAHATPHILGDPAQLAVHIAAAYSAATKSWGGVTIDAHTGKTIPNGAKRYAVTTKPPGMKTIFIDEHASRAQFAHAYKIALSRFSSELDHAQAHLGVFHDDDKHRIDIDPVTVVDSLHDVETIGAASHAIGGAYCFADGNGYWPPHVADADAGAKVIPLHKPPRPTVPQIHKPIALVKVAVPTMTHAQFRAQRPDADDGETLPLELLDDDEDNATVPLIPISKAGEREGHVFRGNQYETGQSDPDDPTTVKPSPQWTPADEDRKLNEYRSFYQRQPDDELQRIHAINVAHANPGRDEVRSLKATTEEMQRRGLLPPPMLHLPLPVATLRGDAKVKGVTVENILTDADNKPLRLAVGDLAHLAYVRDGVAAPPTAIKSAAAFDKTVRTKLMPHLIGKANLAEHGIDSLSKNLHRMAESAVARYLAEPNLLTRDMFYDQWFHTTAGLAKDTGIDQDRIVAAMSNLSAGTTAAYNLRYGVDMAHLVGDNVPLQMHTGDAATDRASHTLFTATIDALEDTAKTYEKKGAAGKELAGRLRWAVQLMQSGAAQTINDLPSDAAARFAHLYRKSDLFVRAKIPFDKRMGDEYTKLVTPSGEPGDLPENHAGFGVSKGYLNYAKATNVLRGYDVVEGKDGKPQRVPFSVSDAVQQVKTRNFVNNILDPNDAHGFDSVTVDYHAMNSSTMSLGGADGDRSSQWNSGATVAGVQLGIRAHVADAIRAEVPYLRKVLNDPTLSSARAQEILWAEWKRGLDSGTTKWDPKGYTPPVWRGYDGVAHPLLDLRSPDKEANKKRRMKGKVEL